MKRGLMLLIIAGLVAIAVYNNLNNANNAAENNDAASGVNTPAQEQAKSASPAIAGVEIGNRAPDFTLQGLDGATYTLKNVGKPVMINFWASWCGPCKIEAPEMTKLYEKYNGQVEIYAVNATSQDSPANAKEFADEFGFKFPVLLDEKGEVLDKYQIMGFPTSYFVDQNGIIIDKVLGLVPPDKLEAMFAKLAEQK